MTATVKGFGGFISGKTGRKHLGADVVLMVYQTSWGEARGSYQLYTGEVL